MEIRKLQWVAFSTGAIVGLLAVGEYLDRYINSRHHSSSCEACLFGVSAERPRV